MFKVQTLTNFTHKKITELFSQAFQREVLFVKVLLEILVPYE